METLENKSFKNRSIAAVILLACFILLAWAVDSGRTDSFDLAAMQFFYSLRNPVTEAILIPLTHCGNWKVIVPLMLILVLIPKTRKRIGLPAALTGALGFAVYKVLKTTIARLRPDDSMWLVTEHGFSFPSGHTMNGLICYGIIAFLAWRVLHITGRSRAARWIAVLLGLLAFLIACSRPFVGVHYPTDVIGGWLMGGAWLLFATVCWDKVFSKNLRKEKTMDIYVCLPCGWEYDPEVGVPEAGIEPGIPFEDLPDDFKCPICGMSKAVFEKKKD